MGKRNKKQWKPYLMHGEARPRVKRPTSVDQPDPRVPEVRPAKLNPEQLEQFAETVDRLIKTDPRLKSVDDRFRQWASTPIDSRGGEPRLAQVMFLANIRAGAVPLSDVESKIVDVVYRTSPKWARDFVHLWYRTGSTPTQIAKELKIKRREYVYDERLLILGYFLGRLEEAFAGPASKA